MKRAVLSLVAAGCMGIATFGLMLAADRIMGRFSPELRLASRMFPPRSTHTVTNPEFVYTASINSLGFRDREYPLKKGGDFRVLILGDSFTYGWGVNLEHCWVKVLEGGLRSKGLRVEIANLGRPGTGPIEYAEIAEIAIPVLRPDLVAVAVLQTDDLQQAGNPALRPRRPPGLKGAVSSVLQRLFPSILVRVRPRRIPAPPWQETAAALRSSLEKDEEKRFNQLDQEIQHKYLKGEMNPMLVYMAIKQPDYFSRTADGNSPFVRTGIQAMSQQFGRVREVARPHGASVVILSVPHPVYVSRTALQTARRLGFVVEEEMLVSHSPDRAIREAAQMQGLPYLQVTEAFRRDCLSGCYFQFDSHFNALGHRVYAQSLAPLFEKLVLEQSTRDRHESGSP